MKIRRFFILLLLVLLLPQWVFWTEVWQETIVQSWINKKNVSGIENLEVNDLFSWAGTYSIPFVFPKGPKGIKPELFLGYNSYSTDAFTPYGYAWNLNIPRINRNPKKGIANMYQNNDFIVNGEELIQDQNNKVFYISKYLNNLNKYYFENNTWRVLDSKGNTYYYGTTDDSKLNDPEDISRTYSWNLVKKVDSRWNEIVYDYFKDNNQVYLDTITYAWWLYKIEFNYVDKATSLSSYRTQFEVKTSKLLSNIVFNTDNTETKRYEFGYDSVNTVFSHLTSVEETSPQPSPWGEGEGRYRKYNFQYGKGKDMHLLKQITDNKWLQVDFEYKPSVFYKDSEWNNINPSLPFNLKTLHKITYLDTTTWVNNVEAFEYAWGAFYFDIADLYGREYAWFARVTKTDIAWKKEIYYFHQWANSTDNPELWEYEDHISKKWKVFRKEIYTSPPTPLLKGEGSQWKWQLLKSEITKWNTDFNDIQWRVLKERETKNLISSDTTTSSAIEYIYDEYSNITEKREYWEVTLMNQKWDFTDIKQDKRTTQFSYAKNEALNLYGFTKSQELHDFNNTLVSKKEILYDDLNTGNISFGDITSIKTYDTAITFSEEKRQYNSEGLLTKTINPRWYETTYTHGAYWIYPVSITKAKWFSELFEYDYSVGKPSKKISINGLETLLEYDSFWRLISEKTSPPTSLLTWEGGQRDIFLMKKVVYNDTSIPNSIQTTLYFDTTGTDTQDIIVYKNSFWNTIQTKKTYKNDYITTKSEYDSRVNKLYASYPTFESHPNYSVLNKVTEFWDSYEYDVLNRVKKISNTSGDIEYSYNNLDFTITNQKWVSTQFMYDIFGNLVGVVEAPPWSPSIEGESWAIARQGEWWETKYEYNTLWQLIKIVDAEGNERNIVYDISGKRLEIEDLHTIGDINFGKRQYEYDKNGNITKYTTLSGDEIIYTYDELDRVKKETSPNPSKGGEIVDETIFVYDEWTNAKGLLSSYSKWGYSENYDYDVFWNIISETKTYQPLPYPPLTGEGIEYKYTTQYSYNLMGQKKSQVYPDGKMTSYNYENGIPKWVNYDGLELIQSVDYNPALKITDLSYANNAITKNIYDYEKGYRLSKKWLLSWEDQYGLTSYTFDNLWNIVRLKEEGTIGWFEKDVTYSYDDLNRLTGADYQPLPNPPLEGEGTWSELSISYSYSVLWNILNNSRVWNYEYIDNGTNNPHAVTKAGDILYTYDANGNVVTDEKRTYTYNSKDELTQSETNSWVVTSYDYNTQWIRVEKRSEGEVNRYVNKDYEVEIPLPNPPLTGEGEEERGTGYTIKTSKYIFFGNQKLATVESVYNPPLTPPSNEGGGVKEKIIYHHEDHLWWGNIDLSSTGWFLQVVDYYPFGSVREKQNTWEYENKYLFGGKEEDKETDLQYFEARYYDNDIGRFRSIDRVFWEVGDTKRANLFLLDPQLFNSYSYARNNPLVYVDPNGESPIAWDVGTWTPLEFIAKAYITWVLVIWKALWDIVSDKIIDKFTENDSMSVSSTWGPGSWGKKPKKDKKDGNGWDKWWWKNAKHQNRDAVNSAKNKVDQLKKQLQDLKNKAPYSWKQKDLQKLQNQLKHQQRKANSRWENHSQKPKWNR